MRSSSAWYTGGAYTTRSKLLATLRPPHLEAFSYTEEDGLFPALSNGTYLTDEHIPPPKLSTQRPSTRRNTHTHTQGRTPVFPDHLVQITPFPIWVGTTISSAIKHSEIIDKDVVHMSMPPTLEAITYHAMYLLEIIYVFQAVKNI
jgi:hypothetical protein